jgi:predicted metalloendopeptidase
VNRLRRRAGAAAFGALLVIALDACSRPAEAPKTEAASTPPARVSGIDLQYVDDSVRAQDDFYQHLNGKWLASTEIPADKAVWGSFSQLADEADKALRDIIENLGKSSPAEGSDAHKIAALYASFMDEARLEDLGRGPLEAEFAKVDAIKDKKALPALIAHLNQIGVTAPYALAVHQDNRDSTRYIVDLYQSGLGLPDRDYYLKADDAKLRDALGKYQTHIEKMLGMAGEKNAAASARDIVALETELARVQWTKVENRDPVKTYNKEPLKELPRLTPGYDWKPWLAAAGVEGKADYLIVSQPSYLTGFSRIAAKTPLPVWKTYFKWHLLSDYAPYLSRAYVDENFAFYGTVLRGVPENRPRWKRGVSLVEESIGEGLGRLYVDKYFPPESKARMEALVKNLLEAYRQDIDTLDWMSPETRKAAQEKLAKFTPKIGYPRTWRDYTKLTTSADDLVGNVMRAQLFEYQRNIDKLGKPIDRDEWGMTPQTVNAYYNPELNEIVFPAAILQPPFFNVKADDAVNYGGIGAVIGHEISHGFDDQGSQYDGDGNLRDWWTKDDHEKFAAKTKALVEQYSKYEPVPGYPVNGQLTLGENIADNSGIAIAYKAYELSLGGQPAPVIDGLSGEQRFYGGWAQVWRAKVREAEAIRRVKVDPHSPPRFRGDGALVNQGPFYKAFDVKEGDKMYLPPEQRVSIW